MMKNAMTFEKAAVYAVSLDAAVNRLAMYYDVLRGEGKFRKAEGVHQAIQILRQSEVHIIPQTEWRETKK